MHRSIRRGLKRKEPGADEDSDGYQVTRSSLLTMSESWLLFNWLNTNDKSHGRRASRSSRLQRGSGNRWDWSYRWERRQASSRKISPTRSGWRSPFARCFMFTISIFITCISWTQGIARFLSACKNETQCLEASKNLLLGQLRVDMLKFELNKLRRGRGSPARKQGNPSYAAVSLSDLR